MSGWTRTGWHGWRASTGSCYIQHRGEQPQLHLMEIRSRAARVEGANQSDHASACDADQTGVKQTTLLPAAAQETLRPLLEPVETMTRQIHVYNERIEQIARTKYPETTLLQQVKGVGT